MKVYSLNSDSVLRMIQIMQTKSKYENGGFISRVILSKVYNVLHILEMKKLNKCVTQEVLTLCRK